MAAVTYLDPADRVEQAWARLRELRSQRFELDQAIIAAEATLDIERKRETPGTALSVLTVKQAATRLQVSENKVWSLIRSGQLAASKLGGNTRVTEIELARYVESGS